MRKFLLAGVAASMFAISACSDKGADADGDGKVSAAEAQKELSQGGAMAMKPGMWEVKISFDSIDAPGMPEAAKAQMTKAMGSGMSVKSCLTKEQAEKPGADFFGGDASANCTFEHLELSRNKMMVQMTCKPQDKMVIASKMDGSFQAESYSMTMEQKASGTPMGEMTMKGKIDGKRLGDCPA